MATLPRQLSEPRVSRHARLNDDDRFQAFDLAHDSVMSAAARPGLILRSDEPDDFSWILVRDVRRSIDTNRAELLASADPSWHLLWWFAPNAARLESLYRAARGERGGFVKPGYPNIRGSARSFRLGAVSHPSSDGAWYVGSHRTFETGSSHTRLMVALTLHVATLSTRSRPSSPAWLV